MRALKLDLSSLYPQRAKLPYDYYILIDEKEVGAFWVESYGPQVVSRLTGERAQVPNVTVSIPRIDALMERLVQNGVGPDHLRDVVDDWL